MALSPEYLKSLGQKAIESKQKAAVQASSSPRVAPAPAPAPMPTEPTIGGFSTPFDAINQTVNNATAKATGDPFAGYVEKQRQAGGPVLSPGADRIVRGNVATLGLPEISKEKQIELYGGEVGSPAYFEYLKTNAKSKFFGKDVLGSLGVQFPDQLSWDKMSPLDQMGTLGIQTVGAAIHMLIAAPKAIATGAVRLGYSIAQPVAALLKGEETSTAALSSKDKGSINVPGLGRVDSYWKSYEDAIKSGNGHLAATLQTVGSSFGDLSMTAVTAAHINSTFRPRATLKPGEAVTNTAPIQEAMLKDQAGVIRRTKGNMNDPAEYYPVTKETAKQYGTNPNQTFLKMTPVGEGKIEVSITEVRGGATQRVKDFLTNTRTKDGKFGREVKVYSEVVDVGTQVPTTGGVAGVPTYRGASLAEWESVQKTGQFQEKPGSRLIDKNTGKEISYGKGEGKNTTTEKKLADLYAAGSSSGGTGVVIEFKPDAMGKMKFSAKFDSTDLKADEFLGKNLSLDDVARVTDSTGKVIYEAKTTPKPTEIKIPTAPPAGMEKLPATGDQLGQINLISEVNGIQPAIRDSLVKSITGKNNIGELTQAEAVKTQQALGLLGAGSKYAPDGLSGVNNVFAQYGSPIRSYFRSVEERTGIPLASRVEIPVENAARYMKVTTDGFFAKAKEVIGSLDESQRSLVGNYMRGNKGAILDNPSLTPELKTQLVQAADGMRSLFNEAGQFLDVPPEIFIDNYLSNIRNIGGVYQLYKEGAPMPAGAEFFAKQKRTGGLGPVLDDPLAIFQIYVKAGSRTKFMGPVLEDIAAMSKDLPPSFQGSIKAYVQEKMGYEGAAEQWLNTAADALNTKLGWNLPPDLARRTTQLIMDTTYAGAMGIRPGTYFRNLISNPVYTYIDRGPAFYTEAMQKALSKEGIAEVRAKGFLNEVGDPYGTAIADEATQWGKLSTKYRQVTQSLLKGQEVTDTFGRTLTYHQTKLQFDDAVAQYNTGKIRWADVEEKLGFSGMSKVDQNEIRQQLVSGNIDKARDHMIRITIDNTQFPYRKGASARIQNGLTGKILTQFGQWANEYAHMLGRMVKYKQWDKLIRFYGTNAILVNSLQGLGANFENSFGLEPAVPATAPAIKIGSELYGIMQSMKSGYESDINKNQAEIYRQLKALGVPAGVQIQSFRDFNKSYEAGPIGPNGKFPVYAADGSLTRYADFSDLFWTMFGFPTNEKVENQEQATKMANQRAEYSNAKQQAVDYLQNGEMEKAQELILQYQLNISGADFEKYYVPKNQRTFQSLPAPVKAVNTNVFNQ